MDNKQPISTFLAIAAGRATQIENKGKIKMKKNIWRTMKALCAVAVFALPAAPAPAQSIGMVADEDTQSVTVFNADTDTVLGTVALPDSGDAIGDCSITADRTLGFVTDFAGNVFVIDLTTVPPSLAAGTNPIPISNNGEDTSISPDQKFLVVCDGGAVGDPISVIDIATRSEISTFSLPFDCNSVDVCSDGSVLVTSSQSGNVRRLTIDGAGNLTDTGEVLFSGGSVGNGPNNVICAPDGLSGIVIRRNPQEIRSFTIPGLALVDIRALTGGASVGISGVFSPAGDRFYGRSNGGAVDVFGYTSVTAQLAAAPSFSIPIASAPTFFGMDQMAMHPSGTKLYVSQPGALNVYDASNGTLLTSITGPSIVQPTGVCVVAQQAGCGGFPCGNNDNKVLLCHVPPGNPANAHTLCISPKAVAAHLESHPGDHCGPCGDGGPLFQADVVQPCPDDVNGDGTVNTLDLIDVLLCLGQPGIPGCEAKDVNGDGVTNVLDLIDLLLAFGTACP